MYIEGYVMNQDELWNAATKEATLATQKAAIKSFFKNGVSKEVISKSMNMSIDEVLTILNED